MTADFTNRDGNSPGRQSALMSISRSGARRIRSGFMLRRLEWIEELNIKYDASTFDTDPSNRNPMGLVKSSLLAPRHKRPPGFVGYLHSRARLHAFAHSQGISIRIWKEKWMDCRMRRMALVIVHPDLSRLRRRSTGRLNLPRRPLCRVP